MISGKPINKLITGIPIKALKLPKLVYFPTGLKQWSILIYVLDKIFLEIQ